MPCVGNPSDRCQAHEPEIRATPGSSGVPLSVHPSPTTARQRRKKRPYVRMQVGIMSVYHNNDYRPLYPQWGKIQDEHAGLRACSGLSRRDTFGRRAVFVFCMVACVKWISYFAVVTLTNYMEPPASDMLLMEKVRDSDMEAFRVLFDRYQPIIFRQALFHIHQTDLAHDIVQETFVRIWEHRASLRPHQSFLALALSICHNLVLDGVKHRKVRERLDKEIPRSVPSEGDDPHEALQRTMLEEELSRVI